MGAALLSRPELVHDILSTLTRNLSIPVTCKIRLLENQLSTHIYPHHITSFHIQHIVSHSVVWYRDDTMRLIKAAESAGVAAIAIHARHISDRPRNPARVSTYLLLPCCHICIFVTAFHLYRCIGEYGTCSNSTNDSTCHL
jgi:tRNA-dihydrouridine synthase 2